MEGREDEDLSYATGERDYGDRIETIPGSVGAGASPAIDKLLTGEMVRPSSHLPTKTAPSASSCTRRSKVR